MADVVTPFIKPEQYLGTSVDGANYLAHVGEHLDHELGQVGHHDWDGVHAAATVDTGLRNPKKPCASKFSWLNDITNTISKANRFINFGQEWDRFFKTCQALVEEGYDLSLKVPKFFSETRFANYASKVYSQFREMYPVLVSCLEDVKRQFCNGTTDQKKKAANAEDILNAIYSVKFALSLAVLCDIYRIFAQMAVLLQVTLD